MKTKGLFSAPSFWWTATALTAVALCVLAVNNGVYTETSPTSLGGHVLLRKLYSIVAFGLIGFGAVRARLAAGQSAKPVAIGTAVAVYSAVIEVLQFLLDPPPEGLAWNAVDVACGFVGGWLAAVFARLRP